MPTPPTVADHWSVPSASADNTTLSKTSYAVSTGDVIVLVGTTWSRDHGLLTPTCAGQTVNPVQTAAPGAPASFWGWVGVWTIKVAGNPGTIDISCAPADTANTRHDLFGIKCTGGDLDVSPATNVTVTATGSPATVALTTVHDNSLIVYGYVDLQSRDPAATTYQSGATQLDIYDGHVGSNSVQASAVQATTTAGSQTIGIANSGGGLTLTIVGVEVKPASSAVTGDATSTITAVSSTAGVNSAVGGGTETITASSSAAGTNNASGGASSPITAGQTAAGANSAVGGATQAVTASSTAAGANAAVGSGTSAVTAGALAAAVAGSVAMQAITVGGTAAAEVTGRPRGSWYQLLDIRRHARQEFEYYANKPPVSCPNDGEPLLPGPASEPGIWFCTFDGWQYPRDWVRPEPPAGLFDGAADAPGGTWAGLP